MEPLRVWRNLCDKGDYTLTHAIVGRSAGKVGMSVLSRSAVGEMNVVPDYDTLVHMPAQENETPALHQEHAIRRSRDMLCSATTGTRLAGRASMR